MRPGYQNSPRFGNPLLLCGFLGAHAFIANSLAVDRHAWGREKAPDGPARHCTLGGCAVRHSCCAPHLMTNSVPLAALALALGRRLIPSLAVVALVVLEHLAHRLPGVKGWERRGRVGVQPGMVARDALLAAGTESRVPTPLVHSVACGAAGRTRHGARSFLLTWDTMPYRRVYLLPAFSR